MAKRQADAPAPGELERRVVGFAEQLGWIVGAAQAKTEGWLAHTQLRKELMRIRDGASDLLAQLHDSAPAASAPAAATDTKIASPAPQSSAGAILAPGKRHRRPPPRQRGIHHSNQQVAKAKLASMRRPRGRR